MSGEPSKTLFEKIIAREIPATIVFEDELCFAIRDINPVAPTHILLIPKKPMPRLCDAVPEDQALLGHLMLIATRIAEAEGYGDAYRLVVNNGAASGQSVFHLHLHIIAGRPLKWPPG
ncbi:histidine triad nucleotide-binding protein [Nevskia ramosa]|uniref:histidine triad nucleotide-binding protein n=1 Tax=Nevskia ramosa TaxID=64002 RepID=UPI0003B76EF0|nr:histidine triad nucleotide-binding protein [Nevskia ramosa]